MDLKNYLLKKKQLKSMQKNYDSSFFSLPFHCPKCHWGTDTLTAYVTHLENHLIKKKRDKVAK
ncbi:MAG: hypothetical protein ACFE9S_15615 [Candidatus Hermodarchaeota archaeon]